MMNNTTDSLHDTALVAGSTGYLGGYVVAELRQRGWKVITLVRDPSKAAAIGGATVVVGDVLRPESLTAACDGVKIVLSCLGASSASGQAPGDAFRPLGEGNLFRAAAVAGSERFIMVSSCNSERHRAEYEGFEAREVAVDAIAEHCAAAGCGISFTVLESSMFFKDADRIYGSMARRGTASALGDGFNRRFNPIHGADLARRMVDSATRASECNSRIAVGGPDTLSLRSISVLAAGAAGVQRPRYRTVPLWAVRLMAFSLGLLGYVWPPALQYGSFARFLLIVSQYDAIGESCGTRRISDYMQELAARQRGGRIAGGLSIQSGSSQNSAGELLRDGKKLL